MIAWTWLEATERSTPLTISVPSSRATCRFLSSSNAIERAGSNANPAPPSLPDELLDPARVPVALRERCHPRCSDGAADEPAAEPERRPERRAARLVVE